MAATARTCPLHALPLEETESAAVGVVLACPLRTCSYAVMPSRHKLTAPTGDKPPRSKRTASKPAGMPAPSEHDLQSLVFDRIHIMEARYPVLEVVFAVPNGGFRHITTGIALKAEGVRPGIPDICIPVPRGQYCGGWIEMKIPGEQPTDDQKKMARRLVALGHWHEVHWSDETAWPALCGYLGIPAS